MAGLAQGASAYSVLVIQDFGEAIHKISSGTHKEDLLSVCTWLLQQPVQKL